MKKIIAILVFLFLIQLAFGQGKIVADLGFGYPDGINLRAGYQYKKMLGFVSYGKFDSDIFLSFDQVSAGLRYNFMEYQSMFVSLQNYWTAELMITHLAKADNVLNGHILNHTSTLIRANIGYLFELKERFNAYVYTGISYTISGEQKNQDIPRFYPYGLSAGFSFQYEIFESNKW